MLARERKSSSPARSECASLRLNSGSVSSFTGSERTTSEVSSYLPEFRSSESLVDSIRSLSTDHYLSTTDHQAYHPTSASRYVPFEQRSPSPDRSESASLWLDSASVLSLTSSETMTSTMSSYYSARSEFRDSVGTVCTVKSEINLMCKTYLYLTL